MLPSLTAQIIRTSWTKKSRGAPLATTRNAIPYAFPIHDIRSGYITIEQRVYGESDAFKTPVTQYEQSEMTDDLKIKTSNLAIYWNGQAIATEFKQSKWEVPLIKSPNPQVGHFIVGVNEWVRFRWRSRLTDYDDGYTWYEHTCINVGCFHPGVSPDVFLCSEPNRQFTHLPHLW